MADVSTNDTADMDPIQQTFVAGNALNAKHFIDQQLQYSNMLLQNAVQHQAQLNAFQSQLNAYSLQAMSRTEAINNASATKSVQSLLDQTSNALADAIIGMQGSKTADNTPPVYQDPSSSIAALASQVSALTQFVQGLSVAPTKTA